MTSIHRKHRQRPAAQLGQQHCQDEAQVAGKSGDPAFRAAKHKQFGLRVRGLPCFCFLRQDKLKFHPVMAMEKLKKGARQGKAKELG